MRFNLGLLTACVLVLATLTGCAGSGNRLPVESRVDLPPVPADLKACFKRKVGIPSAGSMTKRQIAALIAKLKESADAKDDCGNRLVAWYEDIARK